MKSLRPADWADLVERFQQDDVLFQRYYRYACYMHVIELHVHACDTRTCK